MLIRCVKSTTTVAVFQILPFRFSLRRRTLHPISLATLLFKCEIILRTWNNETFDCFRYVHAILLSFFFFVL